MVMRWKECLRKKVFFDKFCFNENFAFLGNDVLEIDDDEIRD